MKNDRSFSYGQIPVRISRQALVSGVHKTVTCALLLVATAAAFAQQSADPFLPSPVRSVSTVPSNGDVNPYGVAFVPDHFQAGSGPLHPGDILVSNFNNKQNLQGTGTTIVRIPSSGAPTTFFQGTAPLGLSTGLGVLQAGLVVVANLPTLDGTAATARPGSLLVINNSGKLIQNFTSPEIQGPWDAAVVDGGNVAAVFVANALNGTVSRLDFTVSSSGLNLFSAKTIASGYMHQPDPAALFDAPTGLVYDLGRDTLFVASSDDNEVFAVRNALERNDGDGPGTVIYHDNTHLHGALAMAAAPNDHLLVTNNDVINSDPNQPSEIVEFTKEGQFVKEIPVDPNQGGSFGLAVNSGHATTILGAVDDNTATITIWTLNNFE
jgi:hypothetical protein